MISHKYRVRLPLMILCMVALAAAPAVAAATTSLTVMNVTRDGKTVFSEQTVSFQWMAQNLPVLGNGVTHYYHQGPVMNASIPDKWNPQENDPVILTKDYGAVKGTDVKDLCNLVGGMDPDDLYVVLEAPDGFSKAFAYSSVYTPQPRTGPVVITWYRADEGYVNQSYATGMRNVMFADTTNNPWGAHVFGLWDMHEAYPEGFWYYYQPGLPSTTGLSVQNIDTVKIVSRYPLPLPGQSRAPADPDNDHLYEDLNGNGFLDFNDLVLLYNHMAWVSGNEPVSLFDFDSSGSLNINDVIRLFQEL
ncbi:MAG: hypothetical protein LUQ25_07985 [Methanoregulaceae archaeon]|nr:hypothetical protein [Methanoregulaceae archaeon]